MTNAIAEPSVESAASAIGMMMGTEVTPGRLMAQISRYLGYSPEANEEARAMIAGYEQRTQERTEALQESIELRRLQHRKAAAESRIDGLKVRLTTAQQTMKEALKGEDTDAYQAARDAVRAIEADRAADNAELEAVDELIAELQPTIEAKQAEFLKEERNGVLAEAESMKSNGLEYILSLLDSAELTEARYSWLVGTVISEVHDERAPDSHMPPLQQIDRRMAN